MSKWQRVPGTTVEVDSEARIVRDTVTGRKRRPSNGRYCISGSFYSIEDLLSGINSGKLSAPVVDESALSVEDKCFVVLGRFISSFTPDSIAGMTTKERLDGVKVFSSMLKEFSEKATNERMAASQADLMEVYAKMHRPITQEEVNKLQ